MRQRRFVFHSVCRHRLPTMGTVLFVQQTRQSPMSAADFTTRHARENLRPQRTCSGDAPRSLLPVCRSQRVSQTVRFVLQKKQRSFPATRTTLGIGEGCAVAVRTPSRRSSVQNFAQKTLTTLPTKYPVAVENYLRTSAIRLCATADNPSDGRCVSGRR